ncbi:hypothetical protein [Gloeothece verrucosa]|uniref:Glycosyltransferase RgtA/B/C/D-like domain-containing protein n=1 Tax=Gloeothece verrucosa (strain PCC 7822) TaxID=497965 RepID=E0U6X0_GLOV7|nr:hypothetical protein [Gloeothece verrucosa]ADN16007.1 hypothetical protein Cyan7822_4087 [Gloeothece verrucosa PCC 7822]
MSHLNKIRLFFSHLGQKARQWCIKPENILFLALIIISLLPLWLFTYFPSQDGPRHLEIAKIIREYHLASNSKFREYYLINSTLSPNWFIYLILLGLMNFFPPLLAEKILLSGYVILFPISLRYALSGISKKSVFLSFLAFPLIYNWALHKGFYNFSYSLPIFFFVLGYWLKYQNRFTPPKILILTLGIVLLYFAHLFSLVMAFIALFIATIWLIFSDLYQPSSEKLFDLSLWSRVLLKRLSILFYLFFPVLVLSLMFVKKSTAAHASIIWGKGLWQVANLLTFGSLTSYDKLEFLFSTAWVILLIVISLNFILNKKDDFDAEKRPINVSQQLLAIFGVYLIIYFVAPSETFTSISIKERLVFYPFFILILWLGTKNYNQPMKSHLKAASILITLLFLLSHSLKYFQINKYLEEYISNSQLIEPNSTVLSLSFDNYLEDNQGKKVSARIQPLLHASGYLAIEKPLVTLNNFPASTDYFPLMYRSQLNPYKHISLKQKTDLDQTPPRVDFLTYPQRTGGQIDYVLVWNYKEKFKNLAAAQSIFQQLQQGYELISSSPQRGLMKLYRRKNRESGI